MHVHVFSGWVRFFGSKVLRAAENELFIIKATRRYKIRERKKKYISRFLSGTTGSVGSKSILDDPRFKTFIRILPDLFWQ